MDVWRAMGRNTFGLWTKYITTISTKRKKENSLRKENKQKEET